MSLLICLVVEDSQNIFQMQLVRRHNCLICLYQFYWLVLIQLIHISMIYWQSMIMVYDCNILKLVGYFYMKWRKWEIMSTLCLKGFCLLWYLQLVACMNQFNELNLRWITLFHHHFKQTRRKLLICAKNEKSAGVALLKIIMYHCKLHDKH